MSSHSVAGCLGGRPADTGPRQEAQRRLVLPTPLPCGAAQPSAAASKGRQPACGERRENVELAGRLSAFGGRWLCHLVKNSHSAITFSFVLLQTRQHQRDACGAEH